VRQEKVQLEADGRKFLTDYVTKGKHSARSIRRARTLLLLDEGKLAQKQIAALLGCNENTICNTLSRYNECGGNVEQAITERPRPGKPTKITPAIEAHITALACAQRGPDGRSAWTLRLIADDVVELGHAADISHETVRQVLKKASSSPGKRNNGASVK
jgi:transposase